MAYMLCKKLIALGQTDGLAAKIEIFHAAGRLTNEQFAELLKALRAGESAV